MLPIVSVGILTALFAGGCSRRDPWQDAPGASATPSGQAPASEAAKAEPPSSLAEQLAREKFTADLDGLVKRRVIRILVVADRTTLFSDGIQMRGLMYDMFPEFEAGLNKKVEDRQCRCVTGVSAG
jgi:hypothetical protein